VAANLASNSSPITTRIIHEQIDEPACCFRGAHHATRLAWFRRPLRKFEQALAANSFIGIYVFASQHIGDIH
jgi:hypothetical protein